MRGPDKRRWRDLCEEAEVEEDPRKLQKLTNQIMRILNDQQKRLKTLEADEDSVQRC